MTAIEHQELKGITVKNLVVTIMGTASIVASVMTTYFNLRSEIDKIRLSQQTEQKVDDLRIQVLETEVGLLQKRVDEIKFNKSFNGMASNVSSKRNSDDLLSSIKPK